MSKKEIETKVEEKTVEVNEVPKEKKKKSNKGLIITVICLVIIIIGLLIALIITNTRPKNNNSETKKEELVSLPKPEVTGGERGKLGIDKNINETTIDNYLGRSDSVYRDMRMLYDPADYEAIGGDSNLSGYVDGFEIVPLPYLVRVTDLPEEVGSTYDGDTLFFMDSDGTYKPNYRESLDIINKLFPKNKYIFLMCGGGGYAGMTKQFLVSLGWDADKIYVVGGYWYYEGEHNIDLRRYNEYGDIYYDFDNIPYHEINFGTLTKINYVSKDGKNKIKLSSRYYNTRDNKDFENGLKEFDDKINDLVDKSSKLYDDYDNNVEEIKKITAEINTIYLDIYKYKADYITKLLEDKESFVIIDYVPSECDSDESVRYNMIDLAASYNLYAYNIEFDAFKETSLYETMKYTPSVIIVHEGQVYAYTNPENDDDVKLTEDYREFEKWFTSKVVVK